MPAQLLIGSIFNLIFTTPSLLVSIGTFPSRPSRFTRKNGADKPVARFLRLVDPYLSIGSDASQIALALTLIVAIQKKWPPKTTIIIARSAMFWQVSLQVVQTYAFIEETLLQTWRWWSELIILGSWAAGTMALFILCFFFDSTGAGPILFASSVVVDHLIATGGAFVSLCLLNPDQRKARKWDIVIGLFYDIVRLVVSICAAIVVAVLVRQDHNKLFDYILQLLLFNLLLGVRALPKLARSVGALLRRWWPRNLQPEATSSVVTSSSQEHINAEEVPSAPEYPDSIQMSEKGVIAESGYGHGSRISP